jgi:hypothetical protein
MHIGLRTQAFGSVEVHTAMRAAQLGVAVSSEKGDLHSFLQTDLPALQNALQQHDLRFENIRFLQAGVGFGSGSSSSPDSRQGKFASGGASSPAEPALDGAEETDEISSSGLTRLSVHA